MSSTEPRDSHSSNTSPAGRSRVSFERLRERTDELELLTSGLALYALISLPSWLWDHYEALYLRMPVSVLAGVVMGLPVLSGMCYVMAAVFLMHLCVRAHWVGLIGLHAAFPDGIRWERLRGVGPITLARLQARTQDLEHGIARADRIASTLFSLISFTAIGIGMLGLWMTLLFVLGGLFGNELGGTNSFIELSMTVLLGCFFFAPILRWLLDGVLARRVPVLARNKYFVVLVRLINGVERLFMPTRLMANTRFTLQSQLLPRTFFALVLFAVILVSYFGSAVQKRRGFDDMFHSQTYISNSVLTGGYQSRYYESQRVPSDRLTTGPVIPEPVIEQAWLPVFLPYAAMRDDPVLKGRCASRAPAPPPNFMLGPRDSDADAIVREAAADERMQQASACMRTLWEIRLNGVKQSLDDFYVTERTDLGMRGLGGYLPLNGLTPGRHRLEAIYRVNPEQDDIREDYVPRRTRYVVPFIWSPEAAAAPALSTVSTGTSVAPSSGDTAAHEHKDAIPPR